MLEIDYSDEALSKCLQDIERADLVIVTMLFMEDHYLPVIDALTAKRHQCDAMVCIMSAPPVMQLTRMGKLSMGGQPSGLMGLLKKLRPKAKDTSDEKSSGKSEGAKQMAMLRRLPKLLRFIPGTAQDLRIFFLTMRYWLAGSEQNITNMVVTLVNRYADGERQNYRQVIEAQEPVEYPEVGLYHPKMKLKITDSLDNLPKALKTSRPSVFCFYALTCWLAMPFITTQSLLH
jgi:magnesium chelatase subunit H